MKIEEKSVILAKKWIFLQYSISIAYLSIFHSRGESEEKKDKDSSVNQLCRRKLSYIGRTIYRELVYSNCEKRYEISKSTSCGCFYSWRAGEMGIKIKSLAML